MLQNLRNKMVNQLPLMGMMAVAALLGATGQLFLKKASGNLKISISGILSNQFLYLFAIFYGAAVLIQLFAYNLGGSISIIYPVVSLSYAFAAFLAWKFLGEPITGWTLAGIIVIILGVSMIGYGATLPQEAAVIR